MHHLMNRPGLPVAVACALLMASPAGHAADRLAAEAPTPRVAYAAVIDKDGKPITDLTAADFEVKEGGKAVEISSVNPAKTPLRVALIVADRGTGIFQVASLKFLQALDGRGEFSIVSVVNQADVVVPYTSDGGALSDALGKIGKRAQSRDGTQTMEAVSEVAEGIRREGTRPVIVLMRIGGEAATGVTSKSVRDRIQKSGAVLYAVSIGGTQLSTSKTEGAFELQIVLGDGTKESGGRHSLQAVTALNQALEQIAAELANQYEISYTLPDGVKPSDRLAVATKRKGVTVLAPTRIPN